MAMVIMHNRNATERRQYPPVTHLSPPEPQEQDKRQSQQAGGAYGDKGPNNSRFISVEETEVCEVCSNREMWNFKWTRGEPLSEKASGQGGL